MTGDIFEIGKCPRVSLRFSYDALMSANHVRYGLANRGAVLNRFVVPEGHLFHKYETTHCSVSGEGLNLAVVGEPAKFILRTSGLDVPYLESVC